HQARHLPASGRAARCGPGERATGRHPPPLPGPAGHDRRGAPVSGRVLDRGSRAFARRRRGRPTREEREAMMDLVKEILIDASPETIFEFLTVPEKHVQWEGTKAELDPRP